MVVIAIIVVLVAVSIPAINAMTKGNDVAQSQNMLSALIANARAIAISQGRMAALVLYEEGSGAGKPAPQTSAGVPRRRPQSFDPRLPASPQATSASGQSRMPPPSVCRWEPRSPPSTTRQTPTAPFPFADPIA